MGVSPDKGAHSTATRLQKHTGTASNVLSTHKQWPSIPEPISVVKTGDGRGPQQAKGEHLEARDDSQMTLVWDVTQTALPFNRAQANKGWRHLQSPMLFWQKHYPPELVFRQRSPAHGLWKCSAQNNPLLLLARSTGQRGRFNPNKHAHPRSL